jgi:orotidine-5'-phosphate decarboxylase
MAVPIPESGRSISFAADVEPELFETTVRQLEGVPGLTSVKIGFEVGLGLGLKNAVEIVHDSGLSAVYDHQKGGNDIPATGENFGRAMKRAGVDAAILFPFAGPITQRKWTRELMGRGIRVISGAEMTHDGIQASGDGQSGGYVHGAAFERMFELAADLGAKDFVVPGNKPDRVAAYRAFFDREIGEGNYSLWAPGFLTQGGDVSATGAVAGPNFNAIVGSGIYGAEDPRGVAQHLGQKILALNSGPE